MWQKTPCPSSSDLKRLIDGTLPASEQKAIDRHLWLCWSCHERLESLAYDQDGSPRSIPCPDHAVLKLHLDGTVSAYAQEAIEHHLESCSSCQAVVEAIDSGEELEPAATSCPDRAVLTRLLDGSLGEREREAIEHHMESCSACQAELDALACGDAAWPRQVRDLGRWPDAESPGLKRVIGVLKDQVNPEEAVTGVIPTAPEEILAFLDPPELPDHLGKLGPYRVVHVLGQGGMGVVLKAFDPALHRSVAIKVLAPQLATTSSARQRFAREARAAAAIRNEHVVAIHSVDEWKGLPYLVMEFIPGVSLQERIDRTAPLDLNSILRIGMQAASGLAAAHAQGLVHRDIKPSNILLENCVERVKITDFGLARAVDDASLTQSGVVAGTPLFMAPEQARSETIDHRADLFSLGAVLYAMCTGRSPFRAPTTLAVLRRVCEEAPRPVREVNRDVPDWLANIIDRLLAKEPASRYQNASEVAELLGRHLARRQESPAWDGKPSKPFTPAVLDEVGPAKCPGRLSRMLKLVAYLVVILAGLLVVTEVTGATRVVRTLARLWQSRGGGACLVVHVTDPTVLFSIDGSAQLRGPGYFDYSFPGDKSGFLVETFKDGQKVAGMHFSARPGLLIELEIGRDGQILVEHDGPIRSPKPREDVLPSLTVGREGPAEETTQPLGKLPLRSELPGCAGLRILEYSPDGRYLIVAGRAGPYAVPEMVLYDRQTDWNGRFLWNGAGPRSLVFTPDSEMFITGDDNGNVRIWDVSSFAGRIATQNPRVADFLMTLLQARRAITSLAVSPDGSLIATGNVKGELKVIRWSPADTSSSGLAISATLGAPIGSLCFTPDGRLLVVALDAPVSSVELYDITPSSPAQIRRRGTLEGTPSNVQSSSFSSDGRLLAIGGKRSVVVWDRQRGLSSELPGLPGGEANQVTRVVYRRGDRHLLAVGFSDGTVSIWEDLCELARIHAHDKWIAGLAFTPDGKSLATAAEDGGQVRLWDLSPVLNVSAKKPNRELDTIPLPPDRQQIGSPPERSSLPDSPARPPEPLGLDRRPIDAKEALKADARWRAAVASEASARASLEKADSLRNLVTMDSENTRALGKVGAVDTRRLDEAALRTSVVESRVQVAKSEVALAEVKRKQVEVAFEREQLQKLINRIKTTARNPDLDPATREYTSRATELEQKDLELTRDAAAAELERARAKLAQATANVAFLTKQLDRFRQLHERHAIEQRLVQETESQLRAAEADQRAGQSVLSAAEESLKAAEESLKARKHK